MYLPIWEPHKIIFSSICFIILLFCVGILQAQIIQHSPAGGNYLILDGENDYAILDFDEFGVLFEEGTKVLTVEAWVYPTLFPDEDIYATIIGQQVMIYAVGHGHPIHKDAKNWIDLNNDDLVLMMFAYTGPNFGTGTMYLALSRHKWHHIAFQAQDGQLTWICDNTWDSLPWGIEGIAHDLAEIVNIPSVDFVLGGYGRKINRKNVTWGSFAGFIDEVRVSDIPRYDIEGELIPQERFEPDANTIALWHFDEKRGTRIFRDSSGNGYHLTGMNGSSVDGTFAVNRYDKLTMTWAAIKIN
ncbi:hypothetical protein GF312_07430 [Candidatus Poribacteria bacterium]|nr:hypothetical protein [Candidatus Poribacteria bacterium]